MNSQTFQWCDSTKWEPNSPQGFDGETNLVLVFGSRELINNGDRIQELTECFSDATIIGCSTAGEINGKTVSSNTLVVTAIEFDSTYVEAESICIDTVEDSYEAGSRLADQLLSDGLEHVFVLSDGLQVNGSKLVGGLDGHLPENVKISGGLAGDADRFEETFIICDGSVENPSVGMIGLYGENINIGFGSLDGWDPFGPERLITRSEGNVLYELDDKPALELYKRYLGDHADDLPASGLLFPLSVRDPDSNDDDSLVRTILSIDEDEQSMTFAGDVMEGHYARLMKTNLDRLIDGARESANHSIQTLRGSDPDLAILISCVGRKLILKQRTEEEVEVVNDVLGEDVSLTGFYSYGEISPLSHDVDQNCELLNQTMTITTLRED